MNILQDRRLSGLTGLSLPLDYLVSWCLGGEELLREFLQLSTAT
jgi:hypothetical protein